MQRKLNIRGLFGGLLLIIATLLYLFTLDNGLRPDELTGGDLITHQYAQVEARPGNAPGYPLYTMGGWLWFHLGRLILDRALNPIQILSFYSTLWGLAALGVLYLILLKIVGRRCAIAWLLTAFYATTFFFWYYSLTTEQYTSAVFQTLLMIWLAFRWDETLRDSLLLWLAFVSGTMLANMVTTLFILPPLLCFILCRRRVSGWLLFDYLKRPKLALQALGIALLPLFSYLYIYIRGAQHPEWRGVGQWPTAWAWFIDFITIQQGRDELAPGLTWQSLLTDEFPALMGQELAWLVLFGGLAGLACLGRRRAGFLYGTLVIYLLFCWVYRFGNWFQVIIPAYPIFIIGCAAGLTWLSERLDRPPNSFAHRRLVANTQRLRPLFYPFTLLLLIALLIFRVTTNLPRVNQRDLPADTALDPGWVILADRPDSPAYIITVFSERLALQYLRAVWGLAPRLAPVDPGNFTLRPALDRHPVSLYISRQAAAVAPDMIQPGVIYPWAAGVQLIALLPEPPRQLPATARPLRLDFGDRLQLLGWELASPSPPLDLTQNQPRPTWQIALYWQTLAPLAQDYTISVRPLLAGQPIMDGQEAVIQDHQPVWGLYPTSQWPPNTLVRDLYILALPTLDTQPDAVQIVVYKTTTAGFENLADQTFSLIR